MTEEETPSQEESTDLVCPRCDNMTSMKGHIVQDGRVIQCPFITVDVVIQQPTKKDRIV